jgi:PrcB C-terminal
MIADALAITTALYFLTSITACSAENMSAVEPVSFVNLDKGFRSGLRERKFVVIKTANEWKELWSSHMSGSIPPKALPSVDFQTEMIVAVFLGERMTGGYGVEITKIEESRQKRILTVTIRETKPPADAMVTQALTQPVHIVKLKKVELAATFVFE